MTPVSQPPVPGHAEDPRAEVARLRKELQDAHEELQAAQAAVEHSVAKANHLAISAELGAIELSQLLNVTPDALWVVDLGFSIRRANDALLKLLGKSRAEVLGRKCFDVFNYGLCHGDGCPISRLQANPENVRLQVDVAAAAPGPDGMAFIASTSRFLGLEGEMTGVVSSFKDITDRQHAQALLQQRNQNLEKQVVLDGLTQLANRRAFDETLKTEWLRAARDKSVLSAIMCDVDQFKIYNDSFGHPAGDVVLKQVAAAMRAVVKRPADLVARYGGEEFVVILPNTPLEGAVSVAEQIRTAVEKLAIPHNTPNGRVTLSLGVASEQPLPATLPLGLVQEADKALYEAKHGGRNRTRAARKDGSAG